MRGEVTGAPPDAALPTRTASTADGARTYMVEADGSISIRDASGAPTATLPSPGADAELLAIRPSAPPSG